MNTADIFKPRPLAFAVAVAVGSLPTMSFAAAGRVQFAFGQVSVQDAEGGNNPATKGRELNAGDTIITERGRVQLKFADGSLVSLQPQSTFKIDEYSYAGKEDGSERSFFSLFRGGLRTITGAIGHRNQGAYRVNTPVATIGIRGTEYLIKLSGSGAVVTVGDGAIAVINDAGEVTLVNGQSGVIVDKNTAVKVTDEKPVLPPNQPNKDLRDDPGTDQPQQDDDDFIIDATGDNGDPQQTLDNLLVGGFPEEPVEPPPPPPPPPPEPTKLESGSGFTVAATYFSGNSEGPVSDLAASSTATFNEGLLTGFSNSNVEGVTAADRGALSLVEAGSDQFIGWGRWSNTSGNNESFTVTRAGNGNSNETFFQQHQSLHYVAGKPTDIPALAQLGETEARYSTLSFTSPTTRDGVVGQLNNATLLLDITNADVSGSASLDINSDNYELTFFGVPVGPTGFASSASVGSGSGGCGSFGCDGFVSGLIAGPRAERAGFVYHVQGNDDVFGAVTFTKDPNGPLPPD